MKFFTKDEIAILHKRMNSNPIEYDEQFTAWLKKLGDRVYPPLEIDCLDDEALEQLEGCTYLIRGMQNTMHYWDGYCWENINDCEDLDEIFGVGYIRGVESGKVIDLLGILDFEEHTYAEYLQEKYRRARGRGEDGCDVLLEIARPFTITEPDEENLAQAECVLWAARKLRKAGYWWSGTCWRSRRELRIVKNKKEF